MASDISCNVYTAGFTAGGLVGNTNARLNDLLMVKYDTGGNKK